MLHVLLGDSAGDTKLLLASAKRRKSLPWIVPKGARVGDPAVFHLPKHGFVARGLIGSEPQAVDRRGRYTATVQDVAPLPAFVPLAFILQNHKQWKWPSYPRSYATIDDAIESRLNDLLDGYQASVKEPLTEGIATLITVTMYERNAIARQECIEHYGSACFACGVSFGEKYGQTAKDYIHVHHLKTVSSRGGAYAVDPIKDLRPICPNCHAVIHLRNPPLSIAELKRMLKAAK